VPLAMRGGANVLPSRAVADMPLHDPHLCGRHVRNGDGFSSRKNSTV
jgi:hypothetical protein